MSGQTNAPTPSVLPDPSTLDDGALDALLIAETTKHTKFEPHDWQVRIAVAVLRRRDVLCIAGTGFGKTLPFVMPLIVTTRMVVWIVSPLNYIEEEQVKAFKDWDVEAVAVSWNTDFNKVKEDILCGKYQVVISSPESFSKANKLRPIVVSEELEEWFHLTVIDEAHCVHTWGKEFRVTYDRCGDMRGFMPANSPLLAATATCTTEIKDKLVSRLFMHNDLLVENLGNFREDLQYEVYVMAGGAKSYHEVCNFIPSRGRLHRMIVFVDSIADAHMIASVVQTHLDLSDDDRPLVQPYHSLRSEQGKEDAAREFAGEECYALMASEALTMGANFQDVETILIFGAPEDVVTLVQRGGRAARNKKIRGRVVVMVTPDQFAKAKKMFKKRTAEAPQDSLDIKVESDGEVDLQDPLGDVMAEEVKVASHSDASSSEDEAPGRQGRKQQASATEAAQPTQAKTSNKSGRRRKAGRSKVLDAGVACFIATDGYHTRVLNEIFGNPPHIVSKTGHISDTSGELAPEISRDLWRPRETSPGPGEFADFVEIPCEEVGGCENCVKKRLEHESNEPDVHTAAREAKREQIDLEFILEDPDVVSQPLRRPVAKNRARAELAKVKKAIEDWQKETFEVERQLQDLEIGDIMTDKALGVIARTRAMDNVDSLEHLEPRWPSRERWGQAVVDVIRQQLQPQPGPVDSASIQRRRNQETARTEQPNTTGAQGDTEHAGSDAAPDLREESTSGALETEGQVGAGRKGVAEVTGEGEGEDVGRAKNILCVDAGEDVGEDAAAAKHRTSLYQLIS